MTPEPSIKIIRSNTILCLCYLLGGCQLTDDVDNDGAALEIADNSYDRLYKKLNDIPRSVNDYYIQFNNDAPIKVVRLYDQESPQYDERGNILSKIAFIKVDDFRFDDYEAFMESAKEEDKIILSRGNIPNRMWWYTKFKGQVEIFW